MGKKKKRTINIGKKNGEKNRHIIKRKKNEKNVVGSFRHNPWGKFRF